MRQGILTILVVAGLALGFAFAANDWQAPWAKPPVHGPEWCTAHDVLLADCEICNIRLARGGTYMLREREPEPGECPNTLMRVTLAPGTAAASGFAVATVEERAIEERLAVNGETRFAPDRQVRVAPLVPGILRELRAQLGQRVEAGDVVATVESRDLGEAKADWIQARALLEIRRRRHAQLAPLAAQGLVPAQETIEAEAAFAEAEAGQSRARVRLAALGLVAEQIERVAADGDTESLFTVCAPIAGTVVERSAVPGAPVGPDAPVLEIADLERLWVTLDVAERDLGRVEIGQRVGFTLDGVAQRFNGKVVAIGGTVNDRTRTVPVFADVKNVRGLLRAQMFGRGEILIRPAEPRLLVPKDAVQYDGDCFLVFVSPLADVFQARKVELGPAYEHGYEVLGGVSPGQQVVTTGSFLLKTELLRGQMGAG